MQISFHVILLALIVFVKRFLVINFAHFLIFSSRNPGPKLTVFGQAKCTAQAHSSILAREFLKKEI